MHFPTLSIFDPDKRHLTNFAGKPLLCDASALCFHLPLSTGHSFQLQSLTLMIFSFDMFDINEKTQRAKERERGMWESERLREIGGKEKVRERCSLDVGQARVEAEQLRRSRCASKVFIYICVSVEGVYAL